MANLPPRKKYPKKVRSMVEAKRMQAHLVRASDLIAEDMNACRSKDLRSRLANSLGSIVRSWRELEEWKKEYRDRREAAKGAAAETGEDDDAPSPDAAPSPNTFEEPIETSKESLLPQTVPTPTGGEGPA